jgi:hypothetical protein
MPAMMAEVVCLHLVNLIQTWEHYSSIRNRDGPHTGPPYVRDLANEPDEDIEILPWMIEAVEKGLPEPQPKEKIREALQEAEGDPQCAIEYLINGWDCESEESGSEFDSDEDEGYETKQQNSDIPDSSSLKQMSSDSRIRDTMVVQYPRKVSKAYPTVPDDPAKNPQLVSKILEQTIAAHLFRSNPEPEEIQAPTAVYRPPEVTPPPTDNPRPFVNPTSYSSQSYVAKSAKPSWPAEITGVGETSPSMDQPEDYTQALYIDPVTGEASIASMSNPDIEHGRRQNSISSQRSAEPMENRSFISEQRPEEPRVNINLFSHSSGTESLQNRRSITFPQTPQLPQATPISQQQPLSIPQQSTSTSTIINPAPDQDAMEMDQDDAVNFIWEALKRPAVAATQPKPQPQRQQQEHEMSTLGGSISQTTMPEVWTLQTLDEIYRPSRTSQGSLPPQSQPLVQPIAQPQANTNKPQQPAAQPVPRTSQTRTLVESSVSWRIHPFRSPQNQSSNSQAVLLTPPFTSLRHPLPPAPLGAPKLSALERLRPVRHSNPGLTREQTQGGVGERGRGHMLPPAPIRPPTLESLEPTVARMAPVAPMASISPPAPGPVSQASRPQALVAPMAPMASMSSSSASSGISVPGALPGHASLPAARPQISRVPSPATADSWGFPDSYPDTAEEMLRRKRQKSPTGSAINTGLSSGISSVVPILSTTSPSNPRLGNTTTRNPFSGSNSRADIGLSLGSFDTVPSLNSGQSPVPRTGVRRGIRGFPGSPGIPGVVKASPGGPRIPGTTMGASSSPKVPGLAAGGSMSLVSTGASSEISRSSLSNIVDDNCSVTSNASNVSASTSATSVGDNEAGGLDTRKRQRPVTTEDAETAATGLDEATAALAASRAATRAAAVEKATQATEDNKQAILYNLRKGRKVGGQITGERITATTTNTAADSDSQDSRESQIFRPPHPSDDEDEEMGGTIVLKPRGNPVFMPKAEAEARAEARAAANTANQALAVRRASRATASRATASRATASRATAAARTAPASHSGLETRKSGTPTKTRPASATAGARTSQTPITPTAPHAPTLDNTPASASATRRSSRIREKKAEPKPEPEPEPKMEKKRKTTKKKKKAVEGSGVTKTQAPTRRSTRKGRGRNRYRELYV